MSLDGSYNGCTQTGDDVFDWCWFFSGFDENFNGLGIPQELANVPDKEVIEKINPAVVALSADEAIEVAPNIL